MGIVFIDVPSRRPLRVLYTPIVGGGDISITGQAPRPFLSINNTRKEGRTFGGHILYHGVVRRLRDGD